MTDATPPRSPRRVLVCGDLVVDHHLYQGERPMPTAHGNRGVQHVPSVGGAEGIRLLLNALDEQARHSFTTAMTARETAAQRAAEAATAAGKSASEAEAEAKAARNAFPPLDSPVACSAFGGVIPPDRTGPQSGHHAFALWQPYPLDRDKPNGEKVWRVDLKMGYGNEPISPTPEMVFTPKPAAFDGVPDLLVLDDAGYLFRNDEFSACWHLPPRGRTMPWILLKLSDPIAQGDLWRALVPGESNGAGYADRLICLVSANDLRNEIVRITPGVSWERTLEDLSDELRRSTLAPLTRCRHLVVVFGGDAALWIDRDGGKAARFCFSPSEAEGDFASRFTGDAVGYLTAMASALAYGIIQSPPGKDLDLSHWMRAGLRAMRDLLQHGHGPVSNEINEQPNGYPVERLAKVILSAGSGDLAQAALRWPRPKPPRSGRPWMIVEASQRPLDASVLPTLVGLAGEVVRHGRAGYGALPHARFGASITADRSEIEMLRGISRLMRQYHRDAKTGTKPLSIGVFGPPGAGKSFTVREIATEIFSPGAWLEFNLSQFSGNDDLNGALHQVRDKILEGLIPVVFWDEFDSSGFKWLQYLLAPLQDGRFQDGALRHAVGRSVFIFAGGTSRRWADFGRPRDAQDERAQQLLKVPDFRSRLDAYYDVSGPNPRWQLDKPIPDPDDIGYTMRRALMIRAHLGVGRDTAVEVDTDLLRALLLVPEYRNGARSLEKLVKSLVQKPGAPLRRSALPPPALLDIFVDAKQFDTLLDAGSAYAEDRAPLEMAPKFHAAYLDRAHADGWTVQPHIDKPFEQLAPALREDNIAAAQRIPSVLALAGLGIERLEKKPASPKPDAKTLEAHLQHNLERLAEAEHDGWWSFRRRNGWVHGDVRDDTRRIHPLMVPYAQLSEAAKDRDRITVLGYSALLKGAGYRVVWL